MEIAEGIVENAQWKQNISTRKDLTEILNSEEEERFCLRGKTLPGHTLICGTTHFTKTAPNARMSKEARKVRGEGTTKLKLQTRAVSKLLLCDR